MIVSGEEQKDSVIHIHVSIHPKLLSLPGCHITRSISWCKEYFIFEDEKYSSMPYTLQHSINCNKFKAKGALTLMDIYSPFPFDSFVNNDKYLITLFTPIYIFTQKSSNCAKNAILSKSSQYHHAYTSPGLGFSFWWWSLRDYLCFS